jgi:hypothetical protein
MKKAFSLLVALSSVLLLIGSAFICAFYLLFEIAPDLSQFSSNVAMPLWGFLLMALAVVVAWVLIHFLRKPRKEVQA